MSWPAGSVSPPAHSADLSRRLMPRSAYTRLVQGQRAEKSSSNMWLQSPTKILRNGLKVKMRQDFSMSSGPISDVSSGGGGGDPVFMRAVRVPRGDSAVGRSQSNRPAAMSSSPVPNEISAPYEVPHYPIEQIETKLAQQKHISQR